MPEFTYEIAAKVSVRAQAEGRERKAAVSISIPKTMVNFSFDLAEDDACLAREVRRMLGGMSLVAMNRTSGEERDVFSLSVNAVRFRQEEVDEQKAKN